MTAKLNLIVSIYSLILELDTHFALQHNNRTLNHSPNISLSYHEREYHSMARAIIDLVNNQQEIDLDLSGEDEQRCQNQILVHRKKFTISKKTEYGTATYSANLKANGQNTFMGTLQSFGHGDCNNVRINDGFRGCRLGTYLMQACLEDDEIGKFDPDHLPSRKHLPKKYCKSFKSLVCRPDADAITGKIPWKACSAYLTAAIRAKYEGMFCSKTIEIGNMNLSELKRKTVWFQIEMAKEFFVKIGAKNFIDTYGDHWHFCKCKDDKVNECRNKNSKELSHDVFFTCIQGGEFL